MTFDLSGARKCECHLKRHLKIQLFFLSLQLQNGSVRLEPLSASLVRSVTAVTAQASVAMVTSASPSMTADVRMGMSAAPPSAQASPNQTQLPAYERGVRYFSLTESGENPTPDVQSPPPAVQPSQSAYVKGGAALISANGQRQDESGRRGRLGYLGREERDTELPSATSPPHTHALRHTPPHGRGDAELSGPREREKESTPISQGGYLSPDTHQTARGSGTRAVISGKFRQNQKEKSFKRGANLSAVSIVSVHAVTHTHAACLHDAAGL